MAKSFHNIISEGNLEVSHKGEDVTLNLPEWLTNLNGKLMDEESLLEQLADDGVLHGILHNGIQKAIIDVRAAARPVVKPDGSTLSIIRDKTAAQERASEHKPAPCDPPSESKGKKANWLALEGTIKPLIEQLNYTSEDCVELLGKSFSPNLIKEVYNHLNQ